jgi:hypothetical protein
MKNSAYDGSGKLTEAIAGLYSLSLKSQARITELIKQAKVGLGITSKARILDDKVKLAIWQWHYDKLHSTHDLFSQVDAVEIFSQPTPNEPVEIISQHETVDIVSQYPIGDLIRIAFYTTCEGVKKRQVIALDRFYVNALMLATGIDKQSVPKWVQQAIDGWSGFNSKLPITRQLKYLLIRELTEHMKH